MAMADPPEPKPQAAPKGVKPWRYIEAIRMESHRKPNAGEATGCEISPDAQHLAICIASRAESKGTRFKPVGTCFPGMRTLSQDTSRGRTYVARLSSELQNAGWLHVTSRKQGKRWRSNIYTIRIPKASRAAVKASQKAAAKAEAAAIDGTPMEYHGPRRATETHGTPSEYHHGTPRKYRNPPITPQSAAPSAPSAVEVTEHARASGDDGSAVGYAVDARTIGAGQEEEEEAHAPRHRHDAGTIGPEPPPIEDAKSAGEGGGKPRRSKLKQDHDYHCFGTPFDADYDTLKYPEGPR